MQVKFPKPESSLIHGRNARIKKDKSTLGGLLEVLSVIGTAVASASFIGYALSWQMLNAYYSELGASWYVNTLTPTQVIQSGAGIYIGLVFMLTWGFYYASSVKNLDAITLPALTLLVVACLINLVNSHPAQNLLHIQVNTYILFVGYFCLAIGCQFLIIEIFYNLKNATYNIELRHIGQILLFYFLAYLPLITNLEITRAATDMDSKVSKLSYAQKKNCAGCIWRIVDAHDGKFLLARISAQMEKRTFVIASMDETWEISVASAQTAQ